MVSVSEMKCIFSIDVEDWFHILDVRGVTDISRWDSLPSRLEKNLGNLLDLLDMHNIKAVCFFLGWAAQKFPHLVREAERRGHEIASHGFDHRLVYKLTPGEFYIDAVKAKAVIEDTVGKEVSGFRASGFSVTEKTPWFFEKLAGAGYRYDSSVFPARRGHGGIVSGPHWPNLINTDEGDVIEFPLSVAKFLGRDMSFFGGGYLRFFPYRLIRKKAGEILKQGQPVIWYLHPREIDPGHPRLRMNPIRRFKSYYNLRSMSDKLKKIFTDFEWTTFSDYIAANPVLRARP